MLYIITPFYLIYILSDIVISYAVDRLKDAVFNTNYGYPVIPFKDKVKIVMRLMMIIMLVILVIVYVIVQIWSFVGTAGY